ncbi:PspC domain-containing protein [Legionella sp.]|uniref:PspC domain-containing protein n=1 Tax=Legionella sp. TaxID=459 RepID=UPI003C899273
MNNLIKSYKRLWRSRRDRKIAGVCGGIGEYFKVDPTWIRITFIIFLLLGGSALLIYVLMWILVPLEPVNWN